MYDRIDEDDLKILVTNRQTLQAANEGTGLWTVVREDGEETVGLTDII